MAAGSLQSQAAAIRENGLRYISGPSRTWIKVKNPKGAAATRAIDWNVHMMKLFVAILLIAAMSVCAQAKSRSAQRVSKGNGVPNWDVSSSCRAAAKVAYTEDAAAREKSCMEGENRTREKLVADWSTFPAAERIRCIKSIEWFSPTYTELAACLEMYTQLRNIRENATTPDKPQR
jgi:hypothetical protein